MTKTKIKIINRFYGGMTRDDKSKIVGSASNIEELDIFSNADYIQAEQIMSSYALPATTEVYAYTSDNGDVLYALGKETSANKIRILSVANGGASNPSTLSTLFTSADTTNLSYNISPFQYFRTTEVNKDFIYFVTNASGVILLKRYNITLGTEETVGTLDALTGSYDKITFKVIFGELFVTNGKYISKVDKDGTFTQHAFTLPNEWIAVDIIAVSDVSVILGQYIDRGANFSKGFWWDLTAITQVDDSFDIPCGGPQWIVNHKETVKMCCSINGVARFFQLSGPFAGAQVIELPGIQLLNVSTATSTQPISSSKMVAVKDKILYFAINKTDKTGIYAIGQIDSDKPNALILSKRFATSDYSLHVAYSLYILGSNYLGAYSDNGTATTVICKCLNTPNRSSSAIYESVVIDDDNPFSNKNLTAIYVSIYPLPASADVNCSVKPDYGSYTEVFRGDGTSLNTINAVLGMFETPAYSGKKVFNIKIELVSSGANSPKLTAIGPLLEVDTKPASQ